jgi:hypothetical protein
VIAAGGASFELSPLGQLFTYDIVIGSRSQGIDSFVKFGVFPPPAHIVP